MKKEIFDFAKFIKDNFFLIIVLIILISPSIWGIISNIYSERVESYKTEIENYKAEIESLKSQNKELLDKKDLYQDLSLKLVPQESASHDSIDSTFQSLKSN